MYMERSSGAKGVGWLMPAPVASLVVLALTAIFWPVAATRARAATASPCPTPAARRRPTAGAASARCSRRGHGRLDRHHPRDVLRSQDAVGAFDWLVLLLHVFGTIAVFAGLALALWHLSVVWKANKRWLGKIWAVALVFAAAHLRLGRGCLPPGRHQHELLMQLSVTRELIPLSAPFTITGYTFTDMSAVVARISERGAAGEVRRQASITSATTSSA